MIPHKDSIISSPAFKRYGGRLAPMAEPSQIPACLSQWQHCHSYGDTLC